TRREGLELSATTKWNSIEIAARYSYIRATFQSPFRENSPNNSSSDGAGAIVVNPGDEIPGIPQQTFKLRLSYAANDTWSIGTTVSCASAIFARGDENNRDRNGRIPGYAVVGINARWRPFAETEVFALLDNVFDQRYANFGVLGRNFFTGPGRTFAPDTALAEQFLGSGVPFGAWIGIRHEWR
ncbi:MAG TPA: TonB-dependent receptor, partial [Usitatibacter sp.]|nr:TonB-dependent receptor [Usitatibacter sp.]